MERKFLLFFIGIANIIGFAYGMYYYSEQLDEWSPLFWIFIIDCPLQAFLIGTVFIASSVKKIKEGTFETIAKFAAVGSIKYGIWTIFVILFHSNYFLTGENAEMYYLLIFAHLGLLIEGILLSSVYRMNKNDIVLFCMLYLMNDYFDYIIGTHPIIPNEGIEIIAGFTVALTFFSILIAKYCGDRKAVKIEPISKYLSA